jgi:hypothetical protein
MSMTDLEQQLRQTLREGLSRDEHSGELLERVTQLLDWHPVDTAPEDGSQILIAYRGGDPFDFDREIWRTTVVFFRDSDWHLLETDTHAFDDLWRDGFELWKPIELPRG